MRKWVFLCLLFLPFLSSAAEREIRIGLIDTFDQDFYLETFVPTIEHIQKTLKDYKITVVELQQNNLLANVVKERPDFLVSSAGNFVTLISKLGAQQIATVSRNHAYSPKEAVSSVFIVRNDRKDLQKITDLKGRVLSATEPHDFDGMLVGMGEIAARGFDPDTFFSKTLFSHYQYPDVATYVKVGAADVGILGTCQYEKLLTTGQIQPGEFRVLEAKNNTEACIRSTERYPDTVFYALDTAPIDEVKAVSLSLLSMPKGEFDFEWVPASGFLKVYDLMKSLKLGPYEHLRETTVKDFILSHQKELLLSCIASLRDIGPCSSSQLARKSPYGRVKVCFSRPASDRTKGSGKPPKTRPSRKKPRDLPNELDFCPRSQTTDHKPDLLRQRAFPASAAAWGKRRQGGIRLKTDEQPG